MAGRRLGKTRRARPTAIAVKDDRDMTRQIAARDLLAEPPRVQPLCRPQRPRTHGATRLSRPDRGPCCSAPARRRRSGDAHPRLRVRRIKFSLRPRPGLVVDVGDPAAAPAAMCTPRQERLGGTRPPSRARRPPTDELSGGFFESRSFPSSAKTALISSRERRTPAWKSRTR